MSNLPKRRRNFEDWLCEQQGVLPRSALRYVLEGLMPFTEANLKLVFRPKNFFDELDKIGDERYKRETIRRAYYEARREQLILLDEYGRVVLSERARRQIVPFKPKKLKGASLLVIFDIPEADKRKREWFRLLLRELKFTQVQKSVWMSEYDCKKIISAGILEQKIEKYVRVFEARAVES